MSGDRFISYGQNHEDVVLWRALGSVTAGLYIDVGASDPVQDSVTKAFYDRGWSGLNIEPLPDVAQQLRDARPRDRTVQAAITSAPVESITLHGFKGTGLSTLDESIARRHVDAGFVQTDIEVPTASLGDVLAENGLAGKDIHFLKVDVEGAEADVLATLDLATWRPWVLVVEATAPNSPEPTYGEWEPRVLAGGYKLCLFDGVSRFYVAQERAADLAESLSYPACVLDGFVSYDAVHAEGVRRELEEANRELQEAKQKLEGAKQAVEQTNRELWDDLVRWRGMALRGWADATARSARVDELQNALQLAHHDAAFCRAELERTRATLSWRVTRPLRTVRGLSRHAGTP